MTGTDNLTKAMVLIFNFMGNFLTWLNTGFRFGSTSFLILVGAFFGLSIFVRNFIAKG